MICCGLKRQFQNKQVWPLNSWSDGRPSVGDGGTLGIGIGKHQDAVDDVQSSGGGKSCKNPPAQEELDVRIALDGQEGDDVAERQGDVFAGRVVDRQVGHQGHATGHGERHQGAQRHEAQQPRAEPVEEQAAGQVVRGDHDAGGHYAGGREHGRRLPVVHGRGHEAAGHEEPGQHGGYEVRVEHADARVAHQLGGVRDEHQRPGELLERQVQAQREERPVHLGTVGAPQELRAGGRCVHVTGRGHLEPELEPGVLGVADAAARLQPRGALGHEQAYEHERRGGHGGGQGGGLPVAEQRAGQVHGQHARRGVHHGPGRAPRREALGAVRGRRHGHRAHEHAGQQPAG